MSLSGNIVETGGKMERGYITAKQAAEKTKYSGFWIRKLCRENLIKCKKIGTMWVIDEQSLRDYETEMDNLGTSKFKHKN
jgi:hypothetical protein